MAALIGVLTGTNGTQESKTTRLGNRFVMSELRTHDGELQSIVRSDGAFVVRINGSVIAEGNVDRNEAFVGPDCGLNAAQGGGDFTPLRDFLAEVEEALSTYKGRAGNHG